MNIKQVPAHSNNYEKGRRDNSIQLIVVHWIVGTLESADATFANPNRLASAHYGIGDSEVHQYVKDEDTAFHAGVFDVNLKSLGIEHAGGPNMPISDETYETSATLVQELTRKYHIPLDREHIKGHREFKATQCPGTLDIDRIIAQAKELQPQTIMDKLRKERDDNWNLAEKYKAQLTQVEPRFEELRKIISDKDVEIKKLHEDHILLSIKNEENEKQIVELLTVKPVEPRKIINVFKELMDLLFKKK